MPEKILIVDDDVDTLKLVGVILERQGYQILASNNGQNALAIAQVELPDLILLDIMMPVMDGYEVTRQLRANPVTSNIPVIMFTAKNQVDDKVTGFEVGADDYLTKPTQPRELFAHVKAVLARRAKSRPVEAPLPQKEKGMVFGVLAAKGGLGISTLVTNLGIMIHNRTQKDVIVAEFRPGEGSISLDLGFTRPEGQSHLLSHRPSDISIQMVERELVTHSSGIRLLLSSFAPTDSKFVVSADQYRVIAEHLSHLGQYVILDLGPSLPPITDQVLKVCDELLVIVEPVPYTLQRTKMLLDCLDERGFGEGRVSLVLVNRVRTEMQLSWTQVREQLGKELIVAFTPAPELTFQSSKVNIPIVIQQPDSLTTQQFTKLADTITKHIRQRV